MFEEFALTATVKADTFFGGDEVEYTGYNIWPIIPSYVASLLR
jgi:hypothetical protein